MFKAKSEKPEWEKPIGAVLLKASLQCHFSLENKTNTYNNIPKISPKFLDKQFPIRLRRKR